MPDEPHGAVGTETSGPESGEDASLGIDGDGADDSGHEASQDDGTSSNDTQDQTTQADASDEDALLNALASGKMADLDGDGKPKPKAKAADADESDADDEKPEDKAEETPDGAKPDGDDPAKATDDDAAREKSLTEKARTKAERKELKKLFDERREIREELRSTKGFADGVAKHAESAGLVRRTDQGLDTSGLYTLIETEKRVQALPPKDQAAYYRELADKLYPDVPKAPPKPVELPQDLKDAVEAGYLKSDEAEALVLKRNPPKPEAKQPEAKPEPAQPQGPTPEAVQQGFASIAEVAKGYRQRFAAEWESMAEKVQKRMKPLLDQAPPSAWKGIAELAMQAEAAERKQAVKKPITATRPSGQPPKRAGAVLSEDEELEALARGKAL